VDRRLVRDGEEGPYNHEFTRLGAAPRLDGWPWSGLSVAAPVDWWDSTKDDFWTAGVDVALRVHAAVTLGGGSAYALYVVDALTGEERERVRSFYASARWKLTGATTLNLRFSVEENDVETYRAFEAGVTHAF
jgi:hypothetical protein